MPSDADKALVTISNVEEACTVTAFRIVKPVYNVYGIERYELVSGAAIADLVAPTHAEVTALAKKARAGSFAEKVEFVNVSGTTTFTAELAAGSWIVLITDPTDAEYVYNPMFVSAYYTNANDAASLVGGTANAAEDFTIGTAAYYAKRSKIDLKKEIVSENRKNPKFDDYKVGDTASFTVETLTPVYDAAYTEIWYYLVDDQCKGLDSATNFKIEYSEDNGTTWKEVESADYTLEKDIEATSIKYAFATGFTNQGTGNDWAINFKPSFLVAHSAANILRVNGGLAQCDYWYDAFDIQPGDAYYVAPEDRVKVWAGYITGEDFLVDGGRALGPTSQAGREELFAKQEGETKA